MIDRLALSFCMTLLIAGCSPSAKTFVGQMYVYDNPSLPEIEQVLLRSCDKPAKSQVNVWKNIEDSCENGAVIVSNKGQCFTAMADYHVVTIGGQPSIEISWDDPRNNHVRDFDFPVAKLIATNDAYYTMTTMCPRPAAAVPASTPSR